MNEQAAFQRRAFVSHRLMRACDSKEKLPSKRVATAHAKRYEAAFGGIMNAYRCPLCKGWHIGHSANRNRP